MCSDFVVGFITVYCLLGYVLQEVQQIPQHSYTHLPYQAID